MMMMMMMMTMMMMIMKMTVMMNYLRNNIRECTKEEPAIMICYFGIGEIGGKHLVKLVANKTKLNSQILDTS